MYHCHTHFYLMGQARDVFEIIRTMPALEAFTHTFSATPCFDESQAARADVILADLCQEPDPPAALDRLCQCKGENAQLILLAAPGQFPALRPWLDQVLDLWPMPMSQEEVRFRFRRWQEGRKRDKDGWQAAHFLDASIDGIPSLVWFKDKNGVHEKVNDSFCQTVNKTKQQVQGQRHAYIWDVEEDDPACIRSEDEVMRTRSTLVSEETVKTKDGTRLLTTYKSPLYDLDGTVMGTVGVGIDITKEHAYAQEVARKNHTLEAILTSLDCGVISHTMDGSRILSVNRAALQITGYDSLEELVGQGFRIFSASVVEEDIDALMERIHSLKNEGDAVSLEYRVRHKNGEVLHLMGSAKLVRENGELVCQRFFLDCTEQKRQEENARARAKQRQMQLVQALSIDYSLVCFCDLDTGEGEILRLEDPDEGIFGGCFTTGDAIAQSVQRYIDARVHSDDKHLLDNVQDRLEELAGKQVIQINYRALVKGREQYYQLKAVRAGSWEESRGVVLGFRCVDSEVREEMEHKRLLEDALLQANRANKAKSVFLSNMSHDIRTPMNAIVGFTSLAITHIGHQEQVEEYLKKIQTSGNHLLSLINDILDMSRIESGKMQLEQKPCSLPEILHSLRSILQADVRANQLELQMDTVDVLHEDVYCDKLRLNQVLLNLLGNAVKFTPAGGVVSLRLTERDNAPEGYANFEFCVQDTGIGMSPEFCQQIFEPFSRERTSTVSGIQGTGLGMAITKNIVDLMDGTIQVESQPGAGTTFTVSLSLRLYAESHEIRTIPELEGLRALVVDDDFNSCDSVSYMLQQLNMRAEWTLSGKEAVLRTRQAAMRQDHYGIYVVDWLLPDMNGVEVTRRIRQEVGDQVPIIILTSYDWADIEEEARQAGVTAFCGKPLFLSELRKCLRSVIAHEEGGRDPQKQEEKHRTTGHILLAEDNELNQEIAVTILEEAGFHTEVASNGCQAVEMLQQSQPGYYQVILMDVRMPVMDGYQATRAIRALEDKRLSSIPIIAMTANAFEEDKQEALRAGMNAHIAKPINIKILFETLDRILPRDEE